MEPKPVWLISLLKYLIRSRDRLRHGSRVGYRHIVWISTHQSVNEWLPVG